jgi:hypothetical protein
MLTNLLMGALGGERSSRRYSPPPKNLFSLPSEVLPRHVAVFLPQKHRQPTYTQNRNATPVPFFVSRRKAVRDRRTPDKWKSPVLLWLYQSYLNAIALRLNQRPRKTLGFETSADRLQPMLH